MLSEIGCTERHSHRPESHQGTAWGLACSVSVVKVGLHHNFLLVMSQIIPPPMKMNMGMGYLLGSYKEPFVLFAPLMMQKRGGYFGCCHS